jgi:hypothetical protein
LLLVEDWDSREQFERNLDAAKLNAIVAVIDLSSGSDRHGGAAGRHGRLGALPRHHPWHPMERFVRRSSSFSNAND